MGEEIVEMLESFVRESIVLIVNSCLNVCEEIFKFFLVLTILYYFALWSFGILDELSLDTAVPGELPATNDFRTVSKTLLRVGAPDEKLIERRASLLERLEIEAEFEENIKQHIKPENTFSNLENHGAALTIRDSDEIVASKDLFISLKKYEANEISQSSQTTKTSLGKRSKPRQDQIEDRPQANSTLLEQQENKESWDFLAKNEFDTDAAGIPSSEHETSPTQDEQNDHERSFSI